MIAELIGESRAWDGLIAVVVIAGVGYIAHQYRRAVRGLDADLFALEWRRNDHEAVLDAEQAALVERRWRRDPRRAAVCGDLECICESCTTDGCECADACREVAP